MKIPAIAIILLTFLANLLVAEAMPDGRPHRLTLATDQFLLDGQPFKIIAGEMHPVRVLPEFWEDRIKKARAMGLNTVSIYVMWNRIEAREGTFDFTGANDIRRFAKLCQENGLWLIVRPGPYIGSEWDWGGFPGWLRTKEVRKLRGADPVMQAAFGRYITKIGEQLADLQCQRGGPILLVQVENEFRTSQDDYMARLVDLFRQAGFDGQLFSNGLWMKSTPRDLDVPGLLYGLDGMNPQHPELLAKAREVAMAKGHPVFCPEVYTAWFTRWGRTVNRKPVESEIKHLEWLFANNVSFCYYVFHGGTSFGYGPEANAITSYDYDAPVDEAGRIRPKYLAIRAYLAKARGVDLPPVPADPAMLEIPSFPVTPRCALLDALGGPPVQAAQPRPFEHLGVAGGFVLYRTRLPGPVTGILDLAKVRHSAVVLVDGAPVGFASPFFYNGQRNTVPIATTKPATLDLLVQNHGRVRPAIDEYVGLNDAPLLAGSPLTGWEMFPLPLDSPMDLPAGPITPGAPAFFTGTFTLERTGETFLDLSGFGHGFVWVNGHNLGRYWEVGPVRSLYLPSAWQQVGTNRITVLDVLPRPGTVAAIRGTSQLVETASIPFPDARKP